MPDDQNTDTQGGGTAMEDIVRHTATDATGCVPPWPYRAPDDQIGAV